MTLSFRKNGSRFFLCWLFYAFFLGILLAEDIQASPSESRPVELIFYGMPTHHVESQLSSSGPLISYFMDEEWHAVPCHWGSLSQAYVSLETQPLRVALALGPGFPLQEIELNLPPVSDLILLVVSPVENNRFEIFPIPLSRNQPTQREATVINLSGETLAINIAEQSRILNPSDRWGIQMGQGSHFQIQAQVAAKHKDRWRLVYRGTYSANTSFDTLLLVHRQNLRSGAITATTLSIP